MLTINGVEPSAIKFNGTDLTEVYAKQGNNTPVLVWASSFTYHWTGDQDSKPGIDSFRTSYNEANNFMQNRNAFRSADTSNVGMEISRSFPDKITTSFELECHAVSYSQMGFNQRGLNNILYPVSWNSVTFNHVSTSYPFSIYRKPAQARIRLYPQYWTKWDGVLQTNYTLPFREDRSNYSLVMPRFNPGVTTYGDNLNDGANTDYTPEINAHIVLDNVPDTLTIPLVYTGDYDIEVDGDDVYSFTTLKCSFDIPNNAVYETSNSTYADATFTTAPQEIHVYVDHDGIENEVTAGDVLGEITVNLSEWKSSKYQYIVWDRWRPIFTNGSTRWAGEWETSRPDYNEKTAVVLN